MAQLGQRAHVANIADFRVTLDGQDLTARFRPRLQSLTLTETRGEEADQLDITLDDADGRLALPKDGAVLRVSLGWKQGSDVAVGLVDKGRFKVDEVTHGGPPDSITIRARSADFAGELRTRREQSWTATTLGAVAADVADRNGLELRCAPALAAVAVDIVAQSRESDMALLRRLGREHDAVATVKNGALILSPIGAGATPSGKALPSIAIRRRDGDRHSYQRAKREEAGGVTATWHDRKAASKKSVTHGKVEGAKRLSRVYASEPAAAAAAKAESSRIARSPATLSFDLAVGRPEIYPEQRVTMSGFKPEIDAGRWLVKEVRHSLGGEGFTTSLQMETIG